MVTLKDVAKEAGVTATTASRALRGMDMVTPKTTQKVLAAAEKLGYRMNISAQSLRTGKSGTVTFLTAGIDGAYFSSLAMRFAAELNKQGMHMLIESSQYLVDEHGNEKDMSYLFSDGIIGINAKHASKALASHPSVLLEDYTIDSPYDQVNAPSQAGTRAAIRHLYEKGCRRIGLVGHDIPPESNPGASQQVRMLAAKHECQELGLEFDEHSLISVPWSRAGGVEAGHRWADERLGFDGLFCPSDGLALGVLRGLADRGVNVPKDVAVIGFDGITDGEYSVPTLSTIAVDFTSMTQAAVSLLTHRINHPEEERYPQTVTVGYRLIERESTRR
ncbi:LacI family transcriptional regulator [Bifidobacterium primatium]|uniref:LacI family transcriptional regulator n=2 Tax=Bifidobacterium TaxID=1678 RepID=A0A2M9H7E0_9BIFI|nr:MULTISPECIES: LacI family DNA-binding transcriptional regulator [Bifidobacterium]NEG95670.1 LacI family DNA-binding transcriptional regulator [Bifidobacterium sp. SMB2]NEH11097.1 LacI family DNA-binding transcriptional regulator [Bifidobacterium saimiriisciurei]PJM72705.1 LacI family transcriptional regulator [Bifidobacterium primatium]